jgi:RNA polymerase sigma-70 factor (ECF subfamily)
MSDPGLATAALVAAARNKDEAALQQLLVRNLPGLEAFVRLRMGAALRGLMTAPDLVQSVCREVLEDLGDFEFRGEGPFRHWLFVRAENKLREKHRYHHRDKRDRQKAVSLSEGTNAITATARCSHRARTSKCRRRCGASRPRSTSCRRTTARP